MRNVENETRVTMNSRRNFVNYATMTLSNGTILQLTPSDFRISGNSFTDDLIDGEDFQIGTAIGKTATLLLDNTDGRTEVVGTSTVTYPHGKFSEYEFYMAYFVLYVCLPEAYHYNGQLRDQMIRIGTFTVTTPTSHGSTIEIVGVDNMYLFDKSFDDCDLDFNTNPSLMNILNKCCMDCGVAIGYSTFDNQNLTVNKRPENATYRQVVSYIAQIAGCNAKISDTGALKLVAYDTSIFETGLDGGNFFWDDEEDTADGGTFEPWNTGYVADGGDFVSALPFHNLTSTTGTSVGTDDIQITGVSIKTEDASVHYPNNSSWDYYALSIEDNPFVVGNESLIAIQLYNKLSSLKFRPFSTSSLQDPTIESGDCCVVYDVKGNMYTSIVTNVTFKTGNYTEIDCHAQSPAKQGSRYSASASVMRVANNMTSYQSQQAHFNEIASEALGYYKTERVDAQTGATITYLHDQPTLESSRNVVKIASGVVAISDNYDTDRTWNSGFDASTGTMLLNLVYVHGLTSDWINTGQLTVGGIDNVDGVIHVMNEKLYGSSTWEGSSHVGEANWWSGFRLTHTYLHPEGAYKLTRVNVHDVTNPSTFYDAGFELRMQYSTNGGSSWTTVIKKSLVIGDNIVDYTMNIVEDDSTIYRLRVGKLGQIMSTDPDFGYSIYTTKTNTVIDKDGITTSNIQINGGGININDRFIVTSAGKFTAKDGEIAGLEIDELEKGLSFNGQMTGGGITRDCYFEISAWGGVTCGTKLSNSWRRMDYVTSYGILKVDYSNAEGLRGFVATAVGNNTSYDPGSSYAYFIADGVHVVSDRRSKTDIEDLDAELCKNLILNSDPVSYRFIEGENTTTHYGFIAQDILELVPENSSIIEYSKSVDRYSMNYQEIIAPLVRVVQEQQKTIDELKERIGVLETIVNKNEQC